MGVKIMITTKNIKISIPQDIFITLNQNENEFIYNLKLNYAIQLFQNGKLSIGKASEFVGISRFTFENLLSEKNIPISDISANEVFNDVKKLSNLLNEKHR